MTRLYLPKVIAQSGAKAYAPENTIAAIHTAADLGVEWVHVDVKLTKDGEAILFHDDTLDRCTSATGLVADTDLAAIRELDAGSWFGESFMGEKIPTLEEALEAILNRGMGLNLELKPCPGREVETAEVALDVITRLWPDEGAAPLISSFSHVSLETTMDMIPEWPRGLIMVEEQDNWQEITAYLKASSLHVDGNTISRDVLEEYMESQLPILAYNIDDTERARELVRWGVDGFLSGNPDLIRESVETKH